MEQLSGLQITGAILWQFLPVWIALVIVLVGGGFIRGKLGLLGKLYDHPIGMIGLTIVLFWVFTALMADWIITFDPYTPVDGMKNKKPGWPVGGQEGHYFLLGGDNLARDVFSRVVAGSKTVLGIAPAATLIAFMVGITLGLPAGFFMGARDTALSFLANMVLAFPVIILFYLLVTRAMVQTGIPTYLAAVLFAFPIIFICTLFYTRFKTRPNELALYMGVTLVVGIWLYFSMVVTHIPNFKAPFADSYQVLAGWLDPIRPFSMDANTLNIFVAVVFVNSPTVFRIVRGLTIDVKTRDYVAAAQTRGESPWYIMLWEILPNVRGPLIVDFCLRIGYTTILLGTLGFFGLGVSPESPDWGATINDGRKLLLIYVHPALPPAISLMSLVLGLNFLADGLREESLKD